MRLLFFGANREFEVGTFQINDPILNANVIFNSATPEPNPAPTPGDVDGNGKVNAKDIIAIMREMLKS